MPCLPCASEPGGCHLAELTQGDHEHLLCRAAGLSWHAGLIPHLLFAALVQAKDELQLLWLHGVEDDDAQPQEQAQQPCNAQSDTLMAPPSWTSGTWSITPAGQGKVLISFSPSQSQHHFGLPSTKENWGRELVLEPTLLRERLEDLGLFSLKKRSIQGELITISHWKRAGSPWRWML